MPKINFSKNLNTIVDLLQVNSQYLSQDDAAVIKGQRIDSPWLNAVIKFSEAELVRFDGLREHELIKNKQWLKTIAEIKRLSSFPVLNDLNLKEGNLPLLGKKKKKHELLKIHEIFNSDSELLNAQSGLDFGGGVGNLSYFLNKNSQKKMFVIEKNPRLIQQGKLRLKEELKEITFFEHELSGGTKSDIMANTDFGIGLHTCGNFANDMLHSCILNNVSIILNWGCCYSKIQADGYNLSGYQKVSLDQRALSAGTLSFAETDIQAYEFRIRVMKYKYSFYNWLYKQHNTLQFIAMGNSRKSLYNKNFSDFVHIQLLKYFKDFPPPESKELEDFFNSTENTELNQYLNAYYAITRYIGELVELYILNDRALYLENNGYEVEILNTFDIQKSSRNKLILAKKRKN